MELKSLKRTPDTALCVYLALDWNIEGLKNLFRQWLAPHRMWAVPVVILSREHKCDRHEGPHPVTAGCSTRRWAVYYIRLLIYGADPNTIHVQLSKPVSYAADRGMLYAFDCCMKLVPTLTILYLAVLK